MTGGAAYLGFNFFPSSPRAVSIAAAAQLAAPARGETSIVAVVVDPDDALVDAIVAGLAPDLFQLHGAETPGRAREIAGRAGAGIIKALPIHDASDLAAAAAYEAAADQMLFDLRPPPGADRPGGLGASFDWDLLAGRAATPPWFLAGGLDAANVAEAIRRSGAPAVDVASGVERCPGVQDPALIAAFLKAVGALPRSR